MKVFFKAAGIAAVGACALLWMRFAGGASWVEAGIGAAIAAVFAASAIFIQRLMLRLSADTLVYGAMGTFVGIAGAYFLHNLLGGDLSQYVPAFTLGFIVMGAAIGAQFSKTGGSRRVAATAAGFSPEKPEGGVREKVLDTSIVIDGRILDIAQTNFIEGPIIIPNFVLREIQLISDSPDPVKRNRGRRGLEMLNKLQQLDNVKVKISYLDYADARDVDAKLVRLTRETGAKLITNDFNLNKVAELQGVDVINLNTLTSALKPVVLPGEEIIIDVIKEGKDENQGIGYLEDGTMVVVENGRQLLGKTVKVNVTSIIQTAAGKMIFTRATGTVDDDDRDDRNKQRGGNGGNQRYGGGNRDGNRDGNREHRDGNRDYNRDDREYSKGGRRR